MHKLMIKIKIISFVFYLTPRFKTSGKNSLKNKWLLQLFRNGIMQGNVHLYNCL